MDEHKVTWDEMVDPAFAEIYHIVSQMDVKNEIEISDLDCEQQARECRLMAYEFVEEYEKMCKYGGEPDYWGMIDSWTRDRAKEKWPPLKHFDVLIDANVTMTYQVLAQDRKDAENQAQTFMSTSGFESALRKEMRIYDVSIVDVIEP